MNATWLKVILGPTANGMRNMLTAQQTIEWVTGRTTPPWKLSDLRSALGASTQQPFSLRDAITKVENQKPTVECYVASIVAAAVSASLKAKKQTVVDSNFVVMVISSPSFSSPAKPLLLNFCKTPECEQVIKDASVIATQVFIIHGGAAVAGQLSSAVSADQIVSAGTAAYNVLTSAKAIPSKALWNSLRARNV